MMGQSKIIFVGDIGAADIQTPDILIARLKEEVANATAHDSWVMLGDNLYPKGLPPTGHKSYQVYAEQLRQQLSLFDKYPGRLIYLLGNHDWNKGRSNGLQYALTQENFINQYFGRTVVYPQHCKPGPEAIELNANQVLLVLNTQWWVQRGQKSLESAYAHRSQYGNKFFDELLHMLHQYSGRQIIIAGHHPLLSNALHGGKFDLLQHLFPLRNLHKDLWVPLPLAGSLYPLYRKWIGTREDISHRLYKQYRKQQLALFEQFKNLIYVSGHDHNLQYFHYKHNHFVVSGAGSKVAYVKSGGKSAFVKAAPGYVILVNGALLQFHYYEQDKWQLYGIDINAATPTQ